jgi:hypothetical protein
VDLYDGHEVGVRCGVAEERVQPRLVGFDDTGAELGEVLHELLALARLDPVGADEDERCGHVASS